MGQNKLQGSEVNYRSLVDLAPDPTYLLDPDGQFLFSNLAGLDLLRCTAEEVVSKSITDTYLPEDLASSQIPIEKWKLGILRFERTFVRGDGTSISSEVSLSPMMPEGRLVIVRDVSERKRAAAEMDTAFEKLRKSEDSLRRYHPGYGLALGRRFHEQFLQSPVAGLHRSAPRKDAGIRLEGYRPCRGPCCCRGKMAPVDGYRRAL